MIVYPLFSRVPRLLGTILVLRLCHTKKAVRLIDFVFDFKQILISFKFCAHLIVAKQLFPFLDLSQGL